MPHTAHKSRRPASTSERSAAVSESLRLGELERADMARLLSHGQRADTAVLQAVKLRWLSREHSCRREVCECECECESVVLSCERPRLGRWRSWGSGEMATLGNWRGRGNGESGKWSARDSNSAFEAKSCRLYYAPICRPADACYTCAVERRMGQPWRLALALITF